MTNYVTSENIGDGLQVESGKLKVKAKAGPENLLKLNEQGELVLTADDLRNALKGEEVRDLGGALKGYLVRGE